MVTETLPTVVADQVEKPVSETQSIQQSQRWFERVGWWAPGLLLALSSLLMVVVYLGTPVSEGNRGLTNLTESFGALERVALWQQALDWIPGIGPGAGDFSLPVAVIAWSARLAIVGMALAQAWAFWMAWRGRHFSLWLWLVPPIVAQAIMVLMVPSNADIFFYEMTGDMAANGINPYAHSLMEFPSSPFLPFNHWVEMTAVYGPAWTSVNAAIMSVTGADPVLATVVFKVFLGIVAVALSVVVYWLAKLLTESAQLATVAAVLVAWQPALILESAGQAHNDPVMLLLSTAAIALVIAGGAKSVRGGVVLMSLSALVKYVTMPLLGLLALTRLADRKQEGGLPRVLLAWVLDVLAFGLVALAGFLPFWNGFSTITEMLAEPGRLYTNPIWFDPYMLIDWMFSRSVANSWANVTRSLMQLVSIAIVLITLGVFAWKCWQMAAEPGTQTAQRLPVWTRQFVISWAVILTTLALLPVNSHPWYWTWPIVPIAVLMAMNGERPEGTSRTAVPIWFWSYLVLTLVMTLAYHTRIVHL